jgi:hypothetical protein
MIKLVGDPWDTVITIIIVGMARAFLVQGNPVLLALRIVVPANIVEMGHATMARHATHVLWIAASVLQQNTAEMVLVTMERPVVPVLLIALVVVHLNIVEMPIATTAKPVCHVLPIAASAL